MSTAILIRTGRRRSRVKRYRFSPGRLERLELRLWREPGTGGVISARLTGQAYVACGAGNEHYPEVEIELASDPRNEGGLGTLAVAALDEADVEAATELAEELENHALEDWSDPCEAELEPEQYDVYGEELES